MNIAQMLDRCGRFVIGSAFYEVADPIPTHVYNMVSTAIDSQSLRLILRSIVGKEAEANRLQIKTMLNCYAVAFTHFDKGDAVKLIGFTIKPMLIGACIDKPDELYNQIVKFKPTGCEPITREVFDELLSKHKSSKARTAFFLRTVWSEQLSSKGVIVDDIPGLSAPSDFGKLESFCNEHGLDKRVIVIHKQNSGEKK